MGFGLIGDIGIPTISSVFLLVIIGAFGLDAEIGGFLLSDIKLSNTDSFMSDIGGVIGDGGGAGIPIATGSRITFGAPTSGEAVDCGAAIALNASGSTPPNPSIPILKVGFVMLKEGIVLGNPANGAASTPPLPITGLFTATPSGTSVLGLASLK